MNIRVDEGVIVRLDPHDVECLKNSGSLSRHFAIQNVFLINVCVAKKQTSGAHYLKSDNALNVALSDVDLARLEDPTYMKDGLEFDGVVIQFDMRRAK